MDKELFETFYTKNFKRLISHLRKIGLLKEDAQDLAQDIMLEIFERYDNDYIEKRPEAYFWKFVNYRLINFLIKKENERRHYQEWYQKMKSDLINSFTETPEVKYKLLEKINKDLQYKGIFSGEAIDFIIKNGVYQARRKYGKKLEQVFKLIKKEL